MVYLSKLIYAYICSHTYILFILYSFLHLIPFPWNGSLLTCIHTSEFSFSDFPVKNSPFAPLKKSRFFIVLSFLKAVFVSYRILVGLFSAHWRYGSNNSWYPLLLLGNQLVICLLNPFPINACSFSLLLLFPFEGLPHYVSTSFLPSSVISLLSNWKSND